MNVGYPYTNESLDAIIQGLEIKQGDKVLSVLGSGDQAFAMLEFAESVIATDNNIRQVKYAEERRNLLAIGNVEQFLLLGNDSEQCTKQNRDRSIDYFKEPGRLERIRQNLGKLKIKEGDFTYLLGRELFTKIYLSNALGYRSSIIYEEACYLAAKMVQSMEIGGLLYISNNEDLERAKYYTDAFVHCNRKDNWPKGLVLDLQLMEKASELEHFWKPAVFRRVI
jgi:hypothetical protein